MMTNMKFCIVVLGLTGVLSWFVPTAMGQDQPQPPQGAHTITVDSDGKVLVDGKPADKNGPTITVNRVDGLSSTTRAVDQTAAPGPAIEPAIVPATAPAGPSKHAGLVQAAISPEARKELDALKEAYVSLTSLDLAGTFSFKFDINGKTGDNSDAFNASYASPGRFRHEMKNDILLGATGQKIYAVKIDENEYLLKDQSKEKMTLANLPLTISRLVSSQNPSLAMALSADPTELLMDEVTEVKKLDDIKIGDKAYTALALSAPKVDLILAIDPQTHLVRRMEMDHRKLLVENGEENVKLAMVTVDYSTASLNPPAKTVDGPKVDPFAWAPPAGARDVTALQAVAEDAPSAKAMEGKPAPDFKLKDLDGKEISLSAQKGHVVLVDFWATWCPPCVASMPHLNKVYEENKGKGLMVIGVSVDQEIEKVAPFVKEKNLAFPVVIDTPQVKAAQLFDAQAIPQTVLIGKDGAVLKVFVGFDPSMVAEMDKAVAKALQMAGPASAPAASLTASPATNP